MFDIALWLDDVLLKPYINQWMPTTSKITYQVQTSPYNLQDKQLPQGI